MVSYAMAVRGNHGAVVEPNDPLFIHPSDHPGQTLVAESFSGEDFDSWKRTFLIALSSRNKVDFVDGSIPRPASGSPLLPYWQRCNDLVASWILNSLKKEISGSVLYCSTAAEMWRELVERFGQSNKAKLFQVKKEMSGISQRDSDIASYYTQAKKIWDEFTEVDDMPRCTCNKCECDINSALTKYTQEQNMIHFLMGLNDSYTSVRGSVLMMNPMPSVAQTYSLLVQEERQRQVKSSTQFMSETASSFNAGAQKVSFQRRPEGRRVSLFCDHCKRQGHTIDKCYKIHGYPNRQPLSQKAKIGRFDNQVWTDTESQSENPKPVDKNPIAGRLVGSSQQVILPGLDAEQSKQLLHFLTQLHANKQSSHEQSSQSFSLAHMAGIGSHLSQYITSVNIACCTCYLDGKFGLSTSEQVITWCLIKPYSIMSNPSRNMLLCQMETKLG